MDLPETVCSDCGKVFKDNRSPEEKMLDSIYGGALCEKCKKKSTPPCSKCNRDIVGVGDGFLYEGKPYHKKCLPGA